MHGDGAIPAPEPRQRVATALDALVRRLGRFMLIYASGSMATLVLGLAITAVMTHAIAPPEYGRLALVLFLASLLTILINLGSLQGAFRLLFGEAELGGEDADAGATHRRMSNQRRALGTAITVTFGVGIAVAGLVAALAPQISILLYGSRRWASLVVLAAVSAVFASAWRLTSNVLRYDRRPAAYVSTEVARPAAVLVAAWILLVGLGRSVVGAMESYVIAGAVALAIALVLVRRDFVPSFLPRQAAQMFRLGASFVPVVLAFFLMQSADVLLLSRFASADAVGVYRVAGSLATPASYAVAVFLLAWGPLSRSPLQTALRRERGEREVGAGLALYYVCGAGWMIVVLAGLADPLAQIAPHSYAGAADLVPILGLVAVARGWLVVVYRVSEYPTSRNYFILSSALGAAAWLGLSFVFIPWLGSYGAALAPITGFLLASVVLVVRSQLGRAPVPFPWLRLLGATVLAAAATIVERRHLAGTGDARGLVAAAVFGVAYPVVLLGLRVIPATHRRELRALFGSVLGSRAERSLEADRLRALAPDRLSAVREFVASDGRELDLADTAGAHTIMLALAEVAGVQAPVEDVSVDVARYLSRAVPLAERDRLGRSLVFDHGVDPLSLDQLSECVAHLRGARLGHREE
jgi:O-antigen/teichoic acid export membrane protein